MADKKLNLIVDLINKTESQFKKLQDDLEAIDKQTANMQQTFGDMAKVGGVAFGVLAYGIGQSVNSFADFDKHIQKAGANTGATADELQKFRDVAVQAGKDTAFSFEEAAAGLAFFAGGSVSATEAIESYNEVVQFAQANNIAIEEAALFASTAMTTFGLSAEETAHSLDLLSVAGQVGFAKTAQLSSAIQKIGPIANTLKIPMGELIATLTALGDLGYIGEQAGTALSSAFTTLAKNAKRTGTETSKALSQLGISIEQLEGALDSPIELVDLFADKFNRLGSETDKVAAASMLFGDAAGPAMVALLAQGSESLEEYAAMFENVDGATANAAARINSARSPVELLSKEIGAANLAIGQALMPTLKQLFIAIQPAIQAVTNFAKEHPKLVSTVLIGAAAIAGLIAVLGTLGLGLIGAAKTVTTMMTVMKFLITTIGSAIKASILLRGIWMTMGIGLLIGLLAVLVTSFMELAKITGGFGNAFIYVWNNIKKTFANTVVFIMEGLNKLFDKIPLVSEVISEDLIQSFRDLAIESDANMTDIVEDAFRVSEGVDNTAASVDESGTVISDVLGDLSLDFSDTADAADESFNKLVESVKQVREEITAAYKDIAKATDDFNKSMGQEQESYENSIVNTVADAYNKKKELERELKRVQREDDPREGEVDRLREQISEQEEIISSYKDLEIDLDTQVAERRKYLQADAIQQLTMDHEKKMLMLKKEYLEEHVKSLQKILLLNQEHSQILALVDEETRHKLEKELEQELSYREKLANQKSGLNTWMAETKSMYETYVRDVQSTLSKISSGGKVKISMSGGASGARAQGGPVQPGRTFLVGEKGPELFTPSAYGRINANGAGSNLTVVFQGNHFTDERYAEQIKKKIVQDLKRVMKVSL